MDWRERPQGQVVQAFGEALESKHFLGKAFSDRKSKERFLNPPVSLLTSSNLLFRIYVGCWLSWYPCDGVSDCKVWSNRCVSLPQGGSMVDCAQCLACSEEGQRIGYQIIPLISCDNQNESSFFMLFYPFPSLLFISSKACSLCNFQFPFRILFPWPPLLRISLFQLLVFWTHKRILTENPKTDT